MSDGTLLERVEDMLAALEAARSPQRELVALLRDVLVELKKHDE